MRVFATVFRGITLRSLVDLFLSQIFFSLMIGKCTDWSHSIYLVIQSKVVWKWLIAADASSSSPFSE